MDSIVGFTLTHRLPPGRLDAALAAQRRVVGAFPHLRSESMAIGESRVEIWGHGDLSHRVARLGDGSLLVLVGSPHGRVSLDDLRPGVSHHGDVSDVELPWDGRVVLLAVSADGRHWTLRNDWLGSIPVFQATLDHGRVASTLEPVAVAGAGCSAGDIFLPALLALLVNGHGLSDWTLFGPVKVVAPDSVTTWDGHGFRSKAARSMPLSDDLHDEPWDDLVDEMFELSRQAVVSGLGGAPSWVLTLSGGLDSRLIAAVCADRHVDVRAYAWGSADTTDVACSREVARALGLPWVHVNLGTDYLARYTRRWAEWFGSSLHFHGMYQMAFFDRLENQPPGPVVSGFLGDVLTTSPLYLDGSHREGRLADEWHTHWTPAEVRSLLRAPVDDAFDELVAEVLATADSGVPGRVKRAVAAELFSRQRLFTAFQATLAHYWRGVSTPFLNRDYARFCLALPGAALEHKRLLADVYRTHYGRVATIPGTYGPEPFIRTGRYLLKRRIANWLPRGLQQGSFLAFRDAPPRMDHHCVQVHGWAALWPIADCRDRLAEWLDLSKIDAAFAAVQSSAEDMRPLRKLQSVQALAYCLLDR